MATNYIMAPVKPGPSFMDTMQTVQGINQLRTQEYARKLAQAQEQTKAKEQARLNEMFGSALKAAHDDPTAENRIKLADLYAAHNPEKAKAF